MSTESERAELEWERRLQEVASSFHYPATPDIHAGFVQKRPSVDSGRRQRAGSPVQVARWPRLALAALLALLLLATLLAVPEVRAAVARFLRVGAITIFVGETEEALGPPAGTPAAGTPAVEDAAIGASVPGMRSTTPTALPTETPTPAAEQGSANRQTPPAVPDMVLSTPIPTPTTAPTATATRPPALAGPLPLAEAETTAGFAIRLPALSTGLGPPDEIYLQQPVQEVSEWAVILVWLEPPELETPRLILHQIGVPDYGTKKASLESVMEAEVNGQPAYWIEGEHLLQVPDGNGDVRERLAGNVLVWAEGELTYRLEGAPTLVEALRIAESLLPAVEN